MCLFAISINEDKVDKLNPLHGTEGAQTSVFTLWNVYCTAVIKESPVFLSPF